MLTKLLLGGAAGAGLLFATAAQAAPILIDDFSDPLATQADCPGGFCSIIGNAPDIFNRSFGGMIGGDRELVLQNTSNGGVVTAIVQGGSFNHGNTGTATGVSQLTWDGAGGGDGLDFGLGNIDLTGGGANLVIHISVLSADLSGSSVQLGLYTSATEYSIAEVSLPVGPSEHFLSLNAFLNPGNLVEQGADDVVNLLSVNAIQLTAVGTTDFDINLDIIEVVPEPMSVGLFGAALLGLAGVRRRAKAA